MGQWDWLTYLVVVGSSEAIIGGGPIRSVTYPATYRVVLGSSEAIVGTRRSLPLT